jgi:hypothetical protein
VQLVNNLTVSTALSIFSCFNCKYVKMRFIEALCPPALLYLIFLVVQLGLDLALGMWATAAIKLVLGAAVVKVLDTFCGIGLTPVSWFLVAAPFVITSLATAISMGTNFDENIFIFLAPSDSKENFTSSNSDGTVSRFLQPNPPSAGGPPEPGITPATQSWTEGSMGNKWGSYDAKWSRDASASGGTALILDDNVIGINMGGKGDFPSAVTK